MISEMIEGEILKVTEGSGESGKGPILYTVMARFPNGSQGIMRDVPAATMFGGMGDFFQYRLRGTLEDSSSTPKEEQLYQDGTRNATLGDRVLITFIGGHISRPMIVGHIPHPNTNWHYEKHSSLKPQATLHYLGVTMQWDDAGQFQLIHRGAPKVKFEPKSDSALGNAAAALTSGSLVADDPTKPGSSSALEPQPDSEVVRMAFLTGGIFRINDHVGQMIEIDHNKNRIYISNNDELHSTDGSNKSGGPHIATNSTDAEYVLWDRDKKMILINARKLLELYSFDHRKDVTDGDYLSKCHGKVDWLIDGNLTEQVGGGHKKTVERDNEISVKGDSQSTVTGNHTASVDGNHSESVKGTHSTSAVGAYSVSSKAGVKMEGTGGLSSMTLENGKVALKGTTGELVDLVAQLAKACMALQVGTRVGESTPPLNIAEFTAIFTKLTGLKG